MLQMLRSPMVGNFHHVCAARRCNCSEEYLSFATIVPTWKQGLRKRKNDVRLVKTDIINAFRLENHKRKTRASCTTVRNLMTPHEVCHQVSSDAMMRHSARIRKSKVMRLHNTSWHFAAGSITTRGAIEKDWKIIFGVLGATSDVPPTDF